MASSAHAAPHAGAHHVDPRVAVPPTSPEETTNSLVGKHLNIGDNFWRAAAAFGVLTILGVIGFVMKLVGGVGDTVIWGYYAAMFSFMVTTASAAPMVAIAPRMANAHWRRPISRAAELWSVVGLLSLLWFIPLLWVLPPLSDGRRSLWFFDMAHPNDVPSYSPHIWASAAILALVVTGAGAGVDVEFAGLRFAGEARAGGIAAPAMGGVDGSGLGRNLEAVVYAEAADGNTGRVLLYDADIRPLPH